MAEQIGYRLTGTIKSVKGSCSAGHKVGDTLDLSAHNAGGFCGFFYHDLFPYIMMLQFGGKFPDDWGDEWAGDTLELECIDKLNAVTIELRRHRE